jgi:hypothetical protein
MAKHRFTPAFLAATAFLLGILGTGCGRKSEAEKTGDKVHEKVENAEDAVTDDKPSEDAREAKENIEDEIKDRKD